MGTPASRNLPYHHAMLHARNALQAGGELITAGRVRWDTSRDCENPQTVVREGRPFRHKPGPSRILVLENTVPCRKCGPCLARRARIWTRRAMAEVAASTRTWFATLTLSPQEQMTNVMRARQQNPGYAELSEIGKFKAQVAAFGPTVQRYLKRVRKQSGARFRYMIVAERHKSGLPHFHMLLHEVSMDQPVRKEILRSQWVHGFSRWKLADKFSARYACKYLSKEASARVRASRFYGNAEVVLQAFQVDLDHRNHQQVGFREAKRHPNSGTVLGPTHEVHDGRNLPRQGISWRSFLPTEPRHSTGLGRAGQRQPAAR